MENELKKRAKFHRKRQKGLPALSTLNPNAGNVEYNVAMFNHMNTPADSFTNNPISGPMGGDVSAPAASGGMGEALATKIDESAMTREQMISELQKAGKRFYFAKYTDGQIYNMYMKYVVNAPKVVDDTVAVEQEPEVFEEKPTCPDCGTRLTDGGYCPKCDDGEEDMDEVLTEGRYDPYWTPYGYRAAAKVITGSAPEYYYHLKEIEMDTGDGVKLAKYAIKKGLPVMVDIKSDPDYPEFYLKDGSNEYHWNDYFYPYGTAHLTSKDYVPYTGQDLNTLYNDIEAAKVATYDDNFDMSTRSLL